MANSTSAVSGVVAALVVFGVSLTAIPVCMAVSASQSLSQPMAVLVIGVLLCFVLMPIMVYRLLIRAMRVTSTSEVVWVSMVVVFSFTSVVDLMIGLTLDGVIDTLHFYLVNGEPYLKSGHGGYINYWDGTVHYGLYIGMAYQIASGSDYRLSALYWFGSIANSLFVFLPGNVIGVWGSELKPAYLLNIPYVAVPIWVAWRLLLSSSAAAAVVATGNTNQANGTRDNTRTLRLRRWPVMDSVLVVYLVIAIGMAWWRLVVAMGSPLDSAHWWLHSIEPYLADASSYPKLQAIVNALYLSPFQLVLLVVLLVPAAQPTSLRTCSYLVDLAAVHAGAYAQGQFAYIAAAVRPFALYPTPDFQSLPEQGLSLPQSRSIDDDQLNLGNT
jgi:hypothetical protein